MNGTAGSPINFNTVKSAEEGVCLKTSRLILNLVTNILIFLTVFVSLLYSLTKARLTVFEIHVISSVLGYQFFMCQGILVLSKYNSWSMLIQRRHRKLLHWILQIMALILNITGSVIIIKEKRTNFNTSHGILALCALILTILSVLNGALSQNAHTFSGSKKLVFIKLTHYVTGIGTLFFATAALCFGFNTHSFRTWIGDDNAVKCLMTLTWIFTLAVSMDFWIASTARLNKLFS